MILLNIKNLMWYFSKRIASLSFSILLLLLICLVTMFGSLIEQNQTLVYYQTNYPINSDRLFEINWFLIMNYGLDHLYQTSWFFLMLIIFVCSLVICTFTTQLPSLKNARRWKFMHSKKSMIGHNHVTSSSILSNNSSMNIIYSLNYYNFYVFHKKYYIYAYKGLLGRIGPIFVHFSMVITLLGALCSLFYGFIIQEIIPNGEFFHLKGIVNAGIYSTLPKNFIGRIDNFLIDYNFDNSIKQFFSQISIFDCQGKNLLNQVISVNSPLNFKGVTFYQTDWKINSIRIQLGSKLHIQKKLIKINLNNKIFWICKLPLSANKTVLLVIFNLNDTVLLYDPNGLLMKTLSIEKKLYINNIAITIKEIMTSTGLQIKVDPGISIVYLGFFTLMISATVSYTSYSQIWLYMTSEFLSLTGSTNRSVFFFEEDIRKISQIYSKYTIK